MHPSVPAACPVDDAVAGRSASSSKSVHVVLFGCSVSMAVFCVVAAPTGAMNAAKPLIMTVALLTVPLLLPAILLHDRKNFERRDAAIMLPWTLVIAMLIVQAAPTTATFAFPLRDDLWRNFDSHLGINVPGIITFVGRHLFLKSVLFDSYAFALHPLVLCAILLPTLLGRREAAQRFVLSNAFSFVLALPLMIFLPAVGPWVGWGFPPDKLQRACEATIHALRHGSLDIHDNFGGIVCLPSYHAFWAIISAQALYTFRYLRYPAILAAGLVTISTVTTG